MLRRTTATADLDLTPSTFAPVKANVDLTKPRTIADYNPHHERKAVPTPFNSERAKEIIANAKQQAKHGPWSDQLQKVMTDGERAYVIAVWDSIPNGESTFMTALHAIENGF